ncbi:hypothetical protein CSC70_12575 [Pseudoxanthomonas kalamensis DSM 18571]|uniref:hypothetical protein n=1 Tax=Pseudoxanthomonas kalamensis TaxID=289483 RepID=UPI001390F899|nr:hypothetical protein [Pseudoxanthomonas kalamensis]KAF1708923.1 hypothetical protein CSC70_12575 [Pseudoxanthomonas kalamensis DSM 18571]
MIVATLRRALLWLAVVAAMPAMAAENPDVTRLQQRLASLSADPAQAQQAAYERLHAQQAVQALAEARRSDRDNALYIAERRVEIAEVAVRTAEMQAELEALERRRSELLVEASRREAARALQEAERLRMQALIQNEEIERLRAEAEAEGRAREAVESTLTTVAGQQAAKLSAARRKEAELARQEAELVSGRKLPASKFDGGGEVFTLGAEAFEGNGARLTSRGEADAAALAAYLQAMPKARAQILGYGGSDQRQARANAVRDALVTAGVGKSRLKASGKGSASGSRMVEVVVAP